ncbi:hypothetical protein NC651_028050 [Populus alba x Populus x berolinensis]|nr:hypothetical protein NC651_028050 [Populus alba x Populus x berolinensis]
MIGFPLLMPEKKDRLGKNLEIPIFDSFSTLLCFPVVVQSTKGPTSSTSSEYYCQYPFPKTESWKDGTDCCLWDGVTCDMKTGEVTELNLSCSLLYGTLHPNNSLLSLHHLQKLDLSFNDFNSSHISSQFGLFSNLTHLNLNSSNFAGQVPLEVSYLSKLISLDLSRNTDLSVEPIFFDKLVRNLTKLRQLDLRWVDMSLVVPSSLMNLSSSLSFLSLEDCRLQGKFPSSMGNLKHLQYLLVGGTTGVKAAVDRWCEGGWRLAAAAGGWRLRLVGGCLP